MNEISEVIPYSAWQQAVFVVLIIVLVVWLLAWMSKQQQIWQDFIAGRDDKWQAFSQEERRENNACLADVNKGIGDLTKVTGKLVQTVDEMRQDICQHDAQAKEILKAVNGNVQKPAPRSRKSGSKA
jgi:hypothetical protein